ncbi:MAG: glycosyltransferase [Halomonadaceae bacterium]|nr:MAG: glycosyltransferase [Halomonadaceae bacterium]
MEKLTITVPVYNEEAVLEDFFQRIVALRQSLPVTLELLFINDGSSDRSLAIIRSFSQNNNWVGYINLSRNFGKEAAMSAAIDHANGDAVVIIDADLQDPPELILEMVTLWREGYDAVYAQRFERQGETWLKKTTAHWFYRLMQGVGGISLPRDTGDFRLLSRRSVLALRQLPEKNRFMKGLFSWIGYPQVALPYSRDPRTAGSSKFNYWKLWNFALDGITSFTTFPLKLATYLGVMIAFSAFIYGAFIVLRTVLFGDPVAGFPTLMTVILFLGGVQLLFLGVLGEYMGRMFDETKNRPLYLVERVALPTETLRPEFQGLSVL